MIDLKRDVVAVLIRNVPHSGHSNTGRPSAYLKQLCAQAYMLRLKFVDTDGPEYFTKAGLSCLYFKLIVLLPRHHA
jgi:hypothetical protein